MDLVGLCSICGRPGPMNTCSICGRLVDFNCFDAQLGICKICKTGKQF